MTFAKEVAFDKKSITLVGMMGSGKTTVGMNLANRIHYDFVDLDQVIVERTELSIVDLINKKGEAYFRELECNLVKEFTEKKKDLSLQQGAVLISTHIINIL